jgi:GNAT superfamily N-acetyltransferase
VGRVVTIGPVRADDPMLGELLARASAPHAASDLAAKGLSPRSWLVGAYDGEALVGMAWARTEWSYEPEMVCVVQQVLVDPARRREGIGTSLVRAVLAEGRRRGACRAVLLMHPPGSREAHLAFYGTLGFAPDDEHPGAMGRSL